MSIPKIVRKLELFPTRVFSIAKGLIRDLLSVLIAYPELWFNLFPSAYHYFLTTTKL